MGSLKLPSSSPASGTISSKDALSPAVCNSGNLDIPQTVTKEEKSSSSSQSLTNSQSCSSDHVRTMSSSWKEDARSPTAGSLSAAKTSSGSSRHRRSSNGFKETNLGKSASLSRSSALDKVRHGTLTGERPLEVPTSDQGNSHRLIVRLPHPGRSPAQTVAGASLEDPSVIGSRVSSPSITDKNENSDRKIKARSDRAHSATNVNAEPRHSSDGKEGLTGCDGSDRSPASTLDGERRRYDQKPKSMDISKAACTSGNEKVAFDTGCKTRNSFSSMNALVESCVKHSEATDAMASASATMSSGDDIGMNLLASVAAGEMSKSELICPKGSPGSSPATEEPHTGNDEAKSRLTCEVGVAQSRGQTNGNALVDSEKHERCAGPVSVKSESKDIDGVSGDKKITVQEDKLTGEHPGKQPVTHYNMHKSAGSCIKSEVKLEDERADKTIPMCTPADVKKETDVREKTDCNGALQHQYKQKNGGQVIPNPVGKLKMRTSLDEKQPADCREKNSDGKTMAENNTKMSDSNGCHSESLASGRNSEKVILESVSSLPFEAPSVAASTEPMTVAEETNSHNVGAGSDASIVNDKILGAEKADSKVGSSGCLHAIQQLPIDSQKAEHLSNLAPSSIDEHADPNRKPLVCTDQIEETVDRKEVTEKHSAGSPKADTSPTPPTQDADRGTKSTGSRLSMADADRGDETASSAPAVANLDAPTKIDFDLNEGISGDDGNPSEPATTTAVFCTPAVHLPCLPSFSPPFISNGSPATITVAAPAKGSFIPPENPCKAEPGWKGSAATSAFRPAEPRKVLEMPLTTTGIPSSAAAAAGKHKRPLFDIDLNVPDESGLEDMTSQSSIHTTGSESGVVSNRDATVRASGGIDLDLNLVGEGADNGQFLGSTSCRLERSVLPVGPPSRGLPIGDTNMSRDFDLNNGPGFDEVGVESLPRSHYGKVNTTVPILPSIAGLRTNNPEFGSGTSWFAPGNSYPAVALPSFLPERGDYPSYPIAAPSGSQRIMGSVAGGSFGGDIYRGPVLSSSPAMAFSPATFPYAGFQLGPNFPIVSTSHPSVSTSYVDSSSGGMSCYPAIPTQFVGSAAALASHYQRPYVLSIPEGGSSGASDSSRRWTRQGLDLNAGPGSADVDVKDDRMSSASRQHPVTSSHAFVEEQARLYQVAGGVVKRKEPEGGWDSDRFSGYKQHTWQ